MASEEPNIPFELSKDSVETPTQGSILQGEDLRAFLSIEDLENLIGDYVAETFHSPKGLITSFRTKIFDLLEGASGLFSEEKKRQLQLFLFNKFNHVSFSTILEGRVHIAKEMYFTDHLFVIEKDGKLASIAGYWSQSQRTVDGSPAHEIRSVYTPNEFRKKGYARKIVSHIVQQLNPIGDPIFMSTESDGMMKIAQELGFVDMDEEILEKNFTESFRDYIVGTKNLGYRVLVLFPKNEI